MLLGRAKVSSLLGLRTADRPASKLVLERDRDCRLTSDRNLDARSVAAEPQIHSSIKPGDIALACCPPALWALCHVFAKPAIAHFPPLFMIGLAYAVSALVLLRLALRSKTRWWAMFTIAAFGGAIQSKLHLQRPPETARFDGDPCHAIAGSLRHIVRPGNLRRAARGSTAVGHRNCVGRHSPNRRRTRSGRCLGRVERVERGLARHAFLEHLIGDGANPGPGRRAHDYRCAHALCRATNDAGVIIVRTGSARGLAVGEFSTSGSRCWSSR